MRPSTRDATPPPCGERRRRGSSRTCASPLTRPPPQGGRAPLFGDGSMNDQGRPTRAEPVAAKHETFTGARGLATEEPLLFEIGRADITGVDVDMPATKGDRLGKHRRKTPIDLPALSEPEAMRHYVRLSQKNYAIDMGIYPLGSCTMKHNPRLNESGGAAAGLFRHPSAAAGVVRAGRAGADPRARPLAARDHRHALGRDAAEGRRAWRALRHDGDQGGVFRTRREPHEGAGAGIGAWHQPRDRGAPRLFRRLRAGAAGRHGARGGREGEARRASGRDRRDHADQPEHLRHLRAGGFEIAEAMHAAGAFFYCDGANLNAIMGKAKPGELGVDAMHINLHKTFSTPHGGGGPGAGPVVLSEALAPFAPLPFVDARRRDASARRARGGCRRAKAVRAHVGLPRPDGDVRARAMPGCCRTAPTACGRRRRTRC